jgi:hypothetical protein
MVLLLLFSNCSDHVKVLMAENILGNHGYVIEKESD